MQIGADVPEWPEYLRQFPIIPSYLSKAAIFMLTRGREEVELNCSTVNDVLSTQKINRWKTKQVSTDPPQALRIHVIDASATVAILLFLTIDQVN